MYKYKVIGIKTDRYICTSHCGNYCDDTCEFLTFNKESSTCDLYGEIPEYGGFGTILKRTKRCKEKTEHRVPSF